MEKAAGECKPDSVRPPKRPDDHSSKQPKPGACASCDATARAAPPPPIWPCTGRGLPCVEALTSTRWALAPPFHPGPRRGGLISVALSFPQVCPVVPGLSTGLPALWCPDFPLRCRSSRPSSVASYNIIRKRIISTWYDGSCRNRYFYGFSIVIRVARQETQKASRYFLPFPARP